MLNLATVINQVFFFVIKQLFLNSNGSLSQDRLVLVFSMDNLRMPINHVFDLIENHIPSQ